MTFEKEARYFLRESQLPAFEELLARHDEYVHRLLFRENADVARARALRALRDHETDKDSSDILEDQELQRQPYVLLIGNAGAGKSLVLTYGYVSAIRQFLAAASAPFPLFLDLGNDLPTALDNASIERALEHRNGKFFKRALSEVPSGSALFLDGLDEVLRRAPRFINDLKFFLEDHKDKLKQIVVACRRAVWSPEWFTRSPVELVVYTADHLGWEEYAQILPEAPVRQAFFEQCDTLGISTLLETPFDGFYLAREFRAGRPLPKTRQECLRQRITEMLQGRESDRRDGSAAPLQRLRFLAHQLACLASFSAQSSWSVQNVVDLIGSSEVLQSEQPIQFEEIRTLFHRPLFKRSGEQFAFTHQLYLEFLAAEALAGLPLYKQQQLLVTPASSYNRIQTPLRGVAAFLAEMSEPFCDYLIKADCLVALFAELPSLPRDKDETLLRAFIDDAIVKNRLPWWEVPPRGERPFTVLPKHRPQNIAAFLQPYLESSDGVARLWGTGCAAVWGGDVAFNDTLSRLALDVLEHISTREWAIEAITSTKDIQTVRSLYSLFDDLHDQIRAEILRAYRLLDAPSPREFITKLCGGSREENLRCLLQTEAETFGLGLDSCHLTEAFQAATENFENLRDLKVYLLKGLFHRADELHFVDIPVELIIKCWRARDRGDLSYDRLFRDKDDLVPLLKIQPALFEEVWRLALKLLGEGDEQINEIRFAERFARGCSDRLFDLLPSMPEKLNHQQGWMIRHTLEQYFYHHPTADRLALFQRSASAFSQRLRLPRPPKWSRPKQPQQRDPLADKQILLHALQSGGHNALAQTGNFLLAVAEISHGPKRREEATEEEVQQVIDRTGSVVRRRAFRAFREGVAQVQYERKETGPSEIFMTLPQYEIPFWVLWQQRESFETQKIAEVLACYGFFGSGDNSRYEQLAEELRQRDKEKWERCLTQLLDEEVASKHVLIKYLIAVKESFYLARCRERLKEGIFDALSFSSFLEYLLAFRPVGYTETLQCCYCLLKERTNKGNPAQFDQPLSSSPDPKILSYRDQFYPLLLLMGDDNDWAWGEFTNRLHQEDVPLNESFLPHSPAFRVPENPLRLPILADWFAFICRKRGKEDYWAPSLASYLREALVSIGGEKGIQELRRLQETQAFPEARWLSYDILRVEDRLLSEGGATWEIGQLLDFLNKEKFGVVLNERDLFRWVCQAIEEVKDALERRGESVSGFWNSDRPKTEPECQNVLWPLVQLTLKKFSIATVEGEEKSIGPHWCDFWVEFPRKGESPFRIAIELKTARQGYGRDKLIEPVEEQLWAKYMEPTKCQHGIFIALWFHDAQRYPWPALWPDRETFAEELRKKCREVEKAHPSVMITSYVVDLTAEFRRH